MNWKENEVDEIDSATTPVSEVIHFGNHVGPRTTHKVGCWLEHFGPTGQVVIQPYWST